MFKAEIERFVKKTLFPSHEWEKKGTKDEKYFPNDWQKCKDWFLLNKNLISSVWEKTNRISKIDFSGDLDLKPDAELETTEFCVPLKILDMTSRNF